MYYSTDGSDGLNHAWHGDTFISVVEFGPTVRAKRIIAYGNATQPGNPFVGSEIPDMSQNILADALLERSDVMNNLHEREILYSN